MTADTIACFLALTKEERTELLRVLQNSLDGARVEQRRTDVIEYYQPVCHDEAILWSLVEKLRQLDR